MKTGAIFRCRKVDKRLQKVAKQVKYKAFNLSQKKSVAVCDYLEPLLAIVLSAIILHESLSVLQIFGGLLIVAGALGSELFAPEKKCLAKNPKV